jgi:hypothetical protein
LRDSRFQLFRIFPAALDMSPRICALDVVNLPMRLFAAKLHSMINVAQSRERSPAQKREQKTRVETALK